jgi:hypothetical protein
MMHLAIYDAVNSIERIGARYTKSIAAGNTPRRSQRRTRPIPDCIRRLAWAEAQLLAGLARGRAEALLRGAYATARGLGALPLCAEIEGLVRRGRRYGRCSTSEIGR